jgi:hypothetical protein
MECFDLINRIKEDKDLRTSATFFYLLIEMLENRCDDIFMHFFLGFTDSIVVLDSL